MRVVSNDELPLVCFEPEGEDDERELTDFAMRYIRGVNGKTKN